MDKKSVILIVDDEPDFLEIFGTQLRASGYEIKAVASGPDAIIAAKQTPPALILMDVNMPGLNGVDTLLQLKDDPDTKDVKVVFLTNLGNDDPISKTINKMASQGISAEGYIKKTEDLSAIVEEVKGYLA